MLLACGRENKNVCVILHEWLCCSLMGEFVWPDPVCTYTQEAPLTSMRNWTMSPRFILDIAGEIALEGGIVGNQGQSHVWAPVLCVQV